MENDWTKLFAGYHDAAVAQGRKVGEILAACAREEPPSLLLNAVNEVAALVGMQEMVLGAIRMGIARGHLTGSESALTPTEDEAES